MPPGTSASAGLLRAWRASLCSVIVSPALLAEYLDVLQRPAFAVPADRARRLCEQIAARAIVVKPRAGRPLLKADPDDDMVLKTALAGKADFLVTDNRRDFEEIASLRGGTIDLHDRGVQVVGLSACLDAIRAAHADAERLIRRSTTWP